MRCHRCRWVAIKHLTSIHAASKQQKARQPLSPGYQYSVREKEKRKFVRCCRSRESEGASSCHCCRSSIGQEVVHAAHEVVVALHGIADVVVVADVAEDDHCAEEMGLARQRDMSLEVLERSVSEEPVHLVHRGNDAVCADHLDRTRSLKPGDARWAVVDDDPVAVGDGVLSCCRALSGH